MPKCDLMKLQSNFIEITLRHGCSPVNLLQIFRAPFPKNTSRGLLLLFQLFREDVSFKYITFNETHKQSISNNFLSFSKFKLPSYIMIFF